VNFTNPISRMIQVLVKDLPHLGVKIPRTANLCADTLPVIYTAVTAQTIVARTCKFKYTTNVFL